MPRLTDHANDRSILIVAAMQECTDLVLVQAEQSVLLPKTAAHRHNMVLVRGLGDSHFWKIVAQFFLAYSP